MKIAKFVCDITVVDPDTNGKVEMSVYKHPNGGLFAIDFSFIDQVLGAETDCDNYKMIPDPLVNAFGTSTDAIMLGENHVA